MNSPKNTTKNSSVDRRHLKPPLEPLPPSRFRSWEDQKDGPSGIQDDLLHKAAPPVRRRRKSSQLWWNRDLRVIVAIAVTAAIAYFVYYTLKG